MSDEARVWFAVGLVAGAVGALVAANRIVAVRRARAAELRAEADAIEAEVKWLQRMDALAAGNAAAAA